MMTDAQRDTLYTDRCRTMTRIGEADASFFLARFALLSIEAIGDTETVALLIADASDGIHWRSFLTDLFRRASSAHESRRRQTNSLENPLKGA
ncbi:hypothetical protein L2Y90_03340 [Burkholderia pyrrocinia]|uniref:hypothetical protein n=1 Tax=Burkholderia pyrrocinia TaxID=60550 RepID=UPI00215AA575|nr:hypothetical protein [Burkholderia pyrrocinia]UVE67266.1 hypothetical protein L2Y90_03340 [Burkholderia pyrrocinia]